jgi:plastocyanin
MGVTSCSNNNNNNNPTAPGPTADVTVSIAANAGNNSFSPNPVVITEGQTIAWKNNHTETHTATSVSGPGAFNTGNLAPGATSAPISGLLAGDYSYHCAIHTTMVGTLTVNPHVVTIVSMSTAPYYSPDPIVIKAGESIVWTNSEPSHLTHTATSDVGSAFVFDTGNIAFGASSTKIVFPTAGTFHYHCTPHPAMVGTITVNP